MKKDVKLAQQIGSLSGKMTTGFKLMSARMNEMNNKLIALENVPDNVARLADHVATQNGRIGKLEKKNEYNDGKNKGSAQTWKNVVVIISVIGGLVALLYSLIRIFG
ncbi:MAG: hypothetical protein KGL39_49665 [Patescibacteria group bacterium]|nr:hypothetical protein [Patescibacteria group bacterium]